MNRDKLAKLQNQVRIGGKGTPRRKKKVVHKTATTDDKRLQTSLKKLAVNNIPGIEEVNMIKDDGNVLHFTNPKVQASLTANTFAIMGHAELKSIGEMLPGIYNQLDLTNLPGKMPVVPIPDDITAIDEADDEVPDLVENFDVPSMHETV